MDANNGGCIEAKADEAKIGNSTKMPLLNSLIATIDYKESRMGATAWSYLIGYQDPRVGSYYTQGVHHGEEGYYALAPGNTEGKGEGENSAEFASAPKVANSDPLYWFRASEVYFLKAEAALFNLIDGDVKMLYEAGVKMSMDDPQIPMLYSQYLLSKNMEQEAVPVLEQVVDLDPTNKAARLMLVSAAVKKEDYKQIIKVCEPGIEATPDALELYYYLAIAYHQAEQGDSVLSVCNRALEHITPDTRKEVISDFYSIMGDIYHTKKQMTEAYAAYDSALVYNPSNIGALNNYAYYLSVERRDLDKAEEMSYKTVKAEPNNSTYLDTYAWILFEKGNYAEARIYIDNAMKNDGEKSDVIVEHCGDIYFMTGDVEGALKYWKKALEMGSESKTLKQKIEKKKYIAE